MKGHDKVRIEGMNKALPVKMSAGRKCHLLAKRWHYNQPQITDAIVSIMGLVSILGCMNYTASLIHISYTTLLSVYTAVVDS